LISTLKPGIVVIDETPSKKLRLFVPGGFAEVAPSGLTILANQAIDLADLDAAKIEAGIGTFEEDISRATSDEVRRAAVEKRDQLLELKAALNL